MSLLQALRRAGHDGKLNVEPAIADGVWVLQVEYEGERPPDVPERWHGHRVVLQEK